MPLPNMVGGIALVFENLGDCYFLRWKTLLLIGRLSFIERGVIELGGAPRFISSEILEIIGAMPDGVGVNSNPVRVG